MADVVFYGFLGIPVGIIRPVEFYAGSGICTVAVEFVLHPGVALTKTIILLHWDALSFRYSFVLSGSYVLSSTL